ncbi:MAG: hypothetical protein L7U47_05895 [Alphaproteobacteria bacterium]|nr:hypothetical protein [Alphaproteobacteria bacterium]
MVRMVNIVLAFVCVILVAALYHIRYSAEAEAKALRQVERIIAVEQDRRRTLEAEWASLNDPRRLQALSQQYLSLDYLRASQVLDLRDGSALSIPVLLVPQGGSDEPH